MNIHDEIMVPNKIPAAVQEKVFETVNGYRTIVPLIGIGWKDKINSWAEK
jgi:hypothetical protein